MVAHRSMSDYPIQLYGSWYYFESDLGSRMCHHLSILYMHSDLFALSLHAQVSSEAPAAENGAD